MDDLHASFARFGPLHAQHERDWQGPFPLPTALASFYAQVGPLGEEINARVGRAAARARCNYRPCDSCINVI